MAQDRAGVLDQRFLAFTLGFMVQEVGRSPDVPHEVIASSDVLRRVVGALGQRSPDERFAAGLELLVDAVAD